MVAVFLIHPYIPNGNVNAIVLTRSKGQVSTAVIAAIQGKEFVALWSGRWCARFFQLHPQTVCEEGYSISGLNNELFTCPINYFYENYFIPTEHTFTFSFHFYSSINLELLSVIINNLAHGSST